MNVLLLTALRAFARQLDTIRDVPIRTYPAIWNPIVMAKELTLGLFDEYERAIKHSSFYDRDVLTTRIIHEFGRFGDSIR